MKRKGVVQLEEKPEHPKQLREVSDGFLLLYLKIWSFHITAGDEVFNSYDKECFIPNLTWIPLAEKSSLTEKSCMTKVSLFLSDLAVNCQPLSSR